MRLPSERSIDLSFYTSLERLSSMHRSVFKIRRREPCSAGRRELIPRGIDKRGEDDLNMNERSLISPDVIGLLLVPGAHTGSMVRAMSGHTPRCIESHWELLDVDRVA